MNIIVNDDGDINRRLLLDSDVFIMLRGTRFDIIKNKCGMHLEGIPIELLGKVIQNPFGKVVSDWR